jgi:hypothetical protein
LETMRRRAAEIGGLLTFESQPDKGTIVRLTFHPRATQQRRRHRMNIRGIWNRRRGIFERERAPASEPARTERGIRGPANERVGGAAPAKPPE